MNADIVIEISDSDLVERAVKNARAKTRMPSPRWIAVKNTFAVGSTTAERLCRKYGLDPHEEVT